MLAEELKKYPNNRALLALAIMTFVYFAVFIWNLSGLPFEVWAILGIIVIAGAMYVALRHLYFLEFLGKVPIVFFWSVFGAVFTLWVATEAEDLFAIPFGEVLFHTLFWVPLMAPLYFFCLLGFLRRESV